MEKETSGKLTPKKNHTIKEQHDGKEEEVNLEGVIGWVFQH
jgi:hypothetical protein